MDSKWVKRISTFSMIAGLVLQAIDGFMSKKEMRETVAEEVAKALNK